MPRGSYVPPSKPSLENKALRPHGAPKGSSRLGSNYGSRVEVARYLSQAVFPYRNRCVTECASGGGLDRQVSSVCRLGLGEARYGTLRCADNYSRTAASIALPELGFFSRKRVLRHACRRSYRLLNATSWRVQQREGRYPQHHLGKRIPRVSGHYIEVEAL